MKRKLDWVSRRNGDIPVELSSKYGPLLSQILWSRGLEDPRAAEFFLNPRLETLESPFRLKDMEGAAERVADAIINKEPIAVYADYDIDGMSGLALLVSFFKSCGAETVIPYQPDRLVEGYGVHAEAIKKLADSGVKIIITVDTGIAAHEAAIESKRLGVDFIVTDHHQQILDLPVATFVVNPNQFSDQSKLGYLSGTGVAFYLAMSVRQKLRIKQHFAGRDEPDLKTWLDLFVLGTIADSVDLLGENRILVRSGLNQLLKTKRAGLKALLAKTLPNANQLSVRDVGFTIAPKLNAASRLGRADLSTKLLLTTDPAEAITLVEEIMTLNSERSEIQSKVYDEALRQAEEQIAKSDPPVLIVHGEWHEGVLGIVAAKLVENLGRPSIVLTQHAQDRLRGSMRTLQHFSCIRALDSCKDLLSRYGGHRMAAGMQLASNRIEEFSETLWGAARKFFDSYTEQVAIVFDGDLPENLDCSEAEALEGMSPWGNGNPEPLLLVRNVDLSASQTLKEQHLKCKLKPGCDLIGFFKAREVKQLQESGVQHFDALVTPEVNRFRNNKSLQLRIQYVRPSQTHNSHT